MWAPCFTSTTLENLIPEIQLRYMYKIGQNHHKYPLVCCVE
jgi:hypothetical protein